MGYNFVKTSRPTPSSRKINTHSSVLLFLFEFQLVSKAPTKVTLDSNGESKGAPFWALCPFMTLKRSLSTAGAPRAHSAYTWLQKNTPAPSTAQSGHQPRAEPGQSQDCSAKVHSEDASMKLSLSTGTTHTAQFPFPLRILCRVAFSA